MRYRNFLLFLTFIDQFLGHELSDFLVTHSYKLYGSFVQNGVAPKTDVWKTHPGNLPNMDAFSRIGLGDDQKIESSNKNWMSFPKIDLSHQPESINFGKIFG